MSSPSRPKVLETFNEIVSTVNEHLCVHRWSKSSVVYTKVNSLGKSEVVTELDIHLASVCARVLEKAFPTVPVLCEESYKGEIITFDADPTFILDPVDGTSELVQGSSFWSVSLAYLEQHRPTAALLHAPERGLTLLGSLESEVLLNGGRIEPEITPTGKFAVSPRQVLIEGFRNRIERTGLVAVPIPTLTQKIIALILGEVDAAAYFPQDGTAACVWDYAASVLLLEKMDGMITSFDGSPLSFCGAGIIHRHGWIATTSKVSHAAILNKAQ